MLTQNNVPDFQVYKKLEIKDEELNKFGKQIVAFTEAFQETGIRNIKGGQFISIEKYRENFIDVIYGSDEIDSRIDQFIKNTPFFGAYSISEVVGQVFPEKYVFYNQKNVTALEILKIDLELDNKDSFGRRFVKFNNAIKPLIEKYEQIVEKRTKTTIPLEFDQFLWYVYENNK